MHAHCTISSMAAHVGNYTQQHTTPFSTHPPNNIWLPVSNAEDGYTATAILAWALLHNAAACTDPKRSSTSTANAAIEQRQEQHRAMTPSLALLRHTSQWQLHITPHITHSTTRIFTQHDPAPAPQCPMQRMATLPSPPSHGPCYTMQPPAQTPTDPATAHQVPAASSGRSNTGSL